MFVPLLILVTFPLTPTVVPSRFGSIDYTWIAVSVGSFEDSHTSDGQGKFYVSKGGYQLNEFTNEGYYGIANETNTIYYRASATFRFGINAYTLAGIIDAFPNIKLDTRDERDYVEILKYPSENIYPPPEFNDLETIYAKINYRTIDFDKTVDDVIYEPFNGVNLKVHDYDGNIPITVQLHEDFGSLESLEVAEGLTFYNPTIIAEVKKVIVDVTRSDVAGDYSDIYANSKEEFGDVSIDFPETTLPSLGEGARKAAVTQTIQNLDLGVDLDPIKEGLTVLGGKTGQTWIRAEPVGTFWDNLQTTSSYSFDLPIRIKPEISYASQDVKVRWAQLKWDYEDVIFSDAGVWVKEGPRTDIYPKYPSVHVTNRYIHQEFNVEMNFIASMQFDPELGGVILEDPFVLSGDFVWDESLFGTSDYTLTQYTPVQDFFDFLFTSAFPTIIIILVAIVGIYIFMKIGMPLLMYRLGRKSRK